MAGNFFLFPLFSLHFYHFCHHTPLLPVIFSFTVWFVLFALNRQICDPVLQRYRYANHLGPLALRLFLLLKKTGPKNAFLLHGKLFLNCGIWHFTAIHCQLCSRTRLLSQIQVDMILNLLQFTTVLYVMCVNGVGVKATSHYDHWLIFYCCVT
jgi:hypothetical protein